MIRERITKAIAGIKDNILNGRTGGEYAVDFYKKEGRFSRRKFVGAGLGLGVGLLLLDSAKPKSEAEAAGIREILKIQGLKNPQQVNIEDGYGSLVSFVEEGEFKINLSGQVPQTLASKIQEAHAVIGRSGYPEAVVTTDNFSDENPGQIIVYYKSNVPNKPGEPGDPFYYQISCLSAGENVSAPKIIIGANGERGAVYIAHLADGRKRVYTASEKMATRARINELNEKIKPLLKTRIDPKSKLTINKQIEEVDNVLYGELEEAKVIYKYRKNGEVVVSSPDLWSSVDAGSHEWSTHPINASCNAINIKTAGDHVLVRINDPGLADGFYFKTFFADGRLQANLPIEVPSQNGRAVDMEIGSGNRIYDSVIAVGENIREQVVMRLRNIDKGVYKLPDLQSQDTNNSTIFRTVAVTGNDETVVRLVTEDNGQRKMLRNVWGRDDNHPGELDLTSELIATGLDLDQVTAMKLVKSPNPNQLDLAVTTTDSIRVFRFNTSYTLGHPTTPNKS